MMPDQINGALEVCLGAMIFANVDQIRRDKQVRGIRNWGQYVVTVWGFWNLYYYPSLGQWVSFVGGIAVVAGNFAWCYYAFKYRRA